MKILYIFPHPDDESFGPAPAMAAQKRRGHEAHLLTLTKGEATKQRFRLKVDKEEMGEIRFKEMQCVENVLELDSMTVTDLPDSDLKNLDPREIEKIIVDKIHELKPDVIVTYAVHGISGFEDHLVSHAVVKRLFCEMRDQFDYPKRLALFTRMGEVHIDGKFRLSVSKDEEINCVEQCSDEDMEKFHRALDCYETYQQVIEDSQVKEVTTKEVPFEFFQEDPAKRVHDIFAELE
jgi:LmbE family N-acetylglucosaminyl deacetylase